MANISGGSSFADAFAENIITGGGVVETRSEITKFVFDGKTISKAVINDTKEVSAKYFISGAHPNVNFKLIEEGHFRKAYVERIKNLENSPGAFSVYIDLKKNCFKHLNSNLYYSKTQDVWNMGKEPIDEWPRGFMLYTTKDENSNYAKSLTIISLMCFEHVKKWKDTKIEKRGEEYKEFKLEKASKLLDLVENKFPEIKESISEMYTSSPLTYRDYTGTEQGSMYGVIKDSEDSLKTYLSAKTKIPNFFLTGQSTNLHGMLGVAMGALITCANIVDLNTLVAKIRNMD